MRFGEAEAVLATLGDEAFRRAVERDRWENHGVSMRGGRARRKSPCARFSASKKWRLGVIISGDLRMNKKLLIFTAVMVAAGRLFGADDAPAPKPDQPEEPKVYTLTDEEKAAGWRLLFDGKNNYGFRGLTYNDFINRGWKIDHGTFFCVKDFKDMGLMTGGHIITEDQYVDFEFAFEWKLSVSGKSGIMYEASGTREKPEGFVYSIIDDVHNPGWIEGRPDPPHRGALQHYSARCGQEAESGRPMERRANPCAGQSRRALAERREGGGV